MNDVNARWKKIRVCSAREHLANIIFPRQSIVVANKQRV